MTFLVYCGEKTCAFNKYGKCRNFKVALNEQGTCMGYSPLIMPNLNLNTSVENCSVINNADSNNPVGFSG